LTYLLHLLILLELYFLIATSLNLLIGYAGLVHVAHAAYYGIGAYVGSLVMVQIGMEFIPATACGALIAAVLSLLVSLPAWHFRGDAFILMSLSVQVGLSAIFYNWTDLTGGYFGLAEIPRPVIAGTEFATPGSILVVYGVIVGGCIGALAALKKSPFGRGLEAMRDDQLAARSLGIPVRRLKVEACAIASGLVAVAGVLYASYATYIDPTSFSLDESILMLSMVVVGGTGNVRGPFVGAVTLIAIPEILRFLDVPDAVAGSLRLLAYGLLLVLLKRLRPQGLAGRYRFE
jgi:branched-chain amino acid transport system permease protein